MDDKNYERTPVEIANGLEVVYVEKGKSEDQVGHAYRMDKDNNFVEVQTESNDCAYGVFSEILRLQNKPIKSIETLRSDTAKYIESNGSYGKVMEAEKWLRVSHPKEANKYIFSAGLKIDVISLVEKGKSGCEFGEQVCNLMENFGESGGKFSKLIEKVKINLESGKQLCDELLKVIQTVVKIYSILKLTREQGNAILNYLYQFYNE